MKDRKRPVKSAVRHRRLSGEWLDQASTRALFSALAGGGYTARAVGGTVRNALLGLPITDIDIATDARPEEVVRLAEAAGLKTVPTGLAHGTVTVISHDHPYEVTTLRRDVTTDGRRAEVAFTADWAGDAARRDFTINAIYCDPDGTLFDPLGGIADLDPPRIRFIGNAADRIAEDYLRILRFFRFSATLSPHGALDPDGLAAAAAGKAGLARISGERIEAELRKLLAAPHAVTVTRAMVECGVLAAAVGIEGRSGILERIAAIEARLAARPDPVLRLAALAVTGEDDARALDRRLKLAARDRSRLIASAASAPRLLDGLDTRAARHMLYRLGPEAYRDRILLAWAKSDAATGDRRLARLAKLPDRWTAPVFPLAGADVVALGVAPGPRIGAILSDVESRWIASDFRLSRDEMLACAHRIAGLSERPHG